MKKLCSLKTINGVVCAQQILYLSNRVVKEVSRLTVWLGLSLLTLVRVGL